MLGKPMERLDVRPKVMGELKFGIDLKMDGMLFAAVKLNPNKGQPMKSYDASKARSMPGVKKILEIKNGVAVVATNSWYAMGRSKPSTASGRPRHIPPSKPTIGRFWSVVQAQIPGQGVAENWRYRRWLEGWHTGQGGVSRTLCGTSAPGAAERDRHRVRRRDGNLG